ncbi:response regulator [Halobacteriovorax marinus]|uniref:Two-component system, response regulator n=1 Tax=Halobacteriovorax marinus (strain ATCC BAA-682 / DSM 15412 / SJ) TaxID=862908 RepID=E1X344_HALMS|nr:response regulator [Halobacteriovorax marinus]ATH08207.1 response regulator [Halobacteriovorax marinus]CBW26874.1 putative two-component system, response regulator [Halobacteriovorax marinus SJ]
MTKKILLIDDEESLLDLLGDFVEDMGHEVELHTNPISALEIYNNGSDNFKMIITDHTMPELSGLSLISKVRESDKNIPCILTSGTAFDEIESLVQSDPNFFYLKKPYKKANLKELLDQIYS